MQHEDLLALLQARQTILPKRLGAPGPDAAQLAAILGAAAHAPDHACLLPWRLLLIPAEARTALGSAFAQALRERDPQATPEQLAQAHDKALRAPLLLALVVDAEVGQAQHAIAWSERVLSAGSAVQNVLLMATALGFGTALTSGKALTSHALRHLLGLGAAQQVLCFVSIGTAQSRKAARVRPALQAYVRILEPGKGMVDWVEEGPPGTT